MNEAAFIAALRTIATDPAARGLIDDVAVLGDGTVLTHDMMVQGVHWLDDADPADVAWKLIAVNLSDLAAKGAAPVGVLLGYTLAGDAAWDERFLSGLGEACQAFGVALLGGDTVAMAPGGRSARSVGLTAVGRATRQPVPHRGGAQVGDAVWVTGVIGDAGTGLALLQEHGTTHGFTDKHQQVLVRAHQRPQPDLAAGIAVAHVATATMDVSDGLLIDAARIASASGVGVTIALDQVPLSEAFRVVRGQDRSARLFAATAGDDYTLLFTLPAGVEPPVPATRIGSVEAGSGLRLTDGGETVPLPDSLGYLHAARSPLPRAGGRGGGDS